jgi:hypothetical protein
METPNFCVIYRNGINVAVVPRPNADIDDVLKKYLPDRDVIEAITQGAKRLKGEAMQAAFDRVASANTCLI